jgi:hypothetical protein
MHALVLSGLIASQMVWLVLLFAGTNQTQRIWAQLTAQLAYLIAFYLFRQAAAEYPERSTMGRAFMALAWSSAASVVRHAIENPWMDLMWPGFYSSALKGLLRQALLVLIIGGLLLGVSAIFVTVRRLDLGFRIRRRDWIGVGLSIAICVIISTGRARLSEAQSTYVWAYALQWMNLCLLLAAAAVSCMLQGLAVQMGGCTLANCFRFLSAHSLLRALLVAVSLFPAIRAMEGYSPTASFIFQFSPWLFALAASARAQLSEIEKTQARQARVLEQPLVEELLLDHH